MALQHRLLSFVSTAAHRIPLLLTLSSLLLVAAFIRPAFADAGILPELQFSTYFGGNGTEYGQDIAIDSDGSIYVAGTRDSTNFPTTTSIEAGDAASHVPALFVSKFDPTGTTLMYSMVLGSGYAEGIAVDQDGSAYVVGEGMHLPTVNAAQPTSGGGPFDAFVAKLNPDGTALVFSTYLGGNGQDMAIAVGVDASQNVYVTGKTDSPNFPTQNAYQGTFGGANDVFITKYDSSGTLLFSSYYGGNNGDVGNDLVADSDGNIYITGSAASSNFPLVNAFQTAPSAVCPQPFGCQHAFVAKLNSSGVPVFSTLLGGNDYSIGWGIAIDSQRNVYVSGVTRATNFPTKNAYQAAPPSHTNAFLTKFNPAGSQLVYSTYLAGTTGYIANNGDSISMGVAVDSAGRATIGGQTVATDFPTVNPIQAQKAGVTNTVDPFVATFSPDGRTLEFSTYLGGSDSEDFPDRLPRVAVDRHDNLLIVGTTGSNDFPILNAYQNQTGGNDDAFITKIIIHQLSEPAEASNPNYYTTDRPTLTWLPVTWATHYHVQVSQDKLFTGTPDFDAVITANALSIMTDHLDDGLYYWHVQAQKADGSWGGYSPTESFTIDAS